MMACHVSSLFLPASPVILCTSHCLTWQVSSLTYGTHGLVFTTTTIPVSGLVLCSLETSGKIIARLSHILQDIYQLHFARHPGIHRKRSQVVTRLGNSSTIFMVNVLAFSIVSFQMHTISISVGSFRLSKSFTSIQSHKNNWSLHMNSSFDELLNLRCSIVVRTQIVCILLANVYTPPPILQERHIGWLHSGFCPNGVWNMLLDILAPFSGNHPICSRISQLKQSTSLILMLSLLCGQILKNQKDLPRDLRI